MHGIGTPLPSILAMCSENVHEIDNALTIVTIAIVSRTYHSNHNYMHKASRDQVPSNNKAGGSSSVDNASNDQSECHVSLGLGKSILQSLLALFTLGGCINTTIVQLVAEYTGKSHGK